MGPAVLSCPVGVLPWTTKDRATTARYCALSSMAAVFAATVIKLSYV